MALCCFLICLWRWGWFIFFLFNVGVSYYQNAKSLRAEMLSWSFVVFRIVWCIKWVFEMILLNNWSSGFRFPDLRQENSAQMWVEVQMNRGKMLEASWAHPWTSVCSPWWGGEQSGRLDKLSSPRDVRPWVQCFPWPSDQGQLHWRSSRGHPGGWSLWRKSDYPGKHCLRPFRFLEARLSQNQFSSGLNHWHQELNLQLLCKMSLSRHDRKIETANETDLVFSLLVFPDQLPTLCACFFPFPLHMCVHARVCAGVCKPEANLSCRCPATPTGPDLTK